MVSEVLYNLWRKLFPENAKPSIEFPRALQTSIIPFATQVDTLIEKVFESPIELEYVELKGDLLNNDLTTVRVNQSDKDYNGVFNLSPSCECKSLKISPKSWNGVRFGYLVLKYVGSYFVGAPVGFLGQPVEVIGRINEIKMLDFIANIMEIDLIQRISQINLIKDITKIGEIVKIDQIGDITGKIKIDQLIPTPSTDRLYASTTLITDNETDLKIVNGIGMCDYLWVQAGGFTNSHLVKIRIYCDTVKVFEHDFSTLNWLGYTASTPSISLLKYAVSGFCSFQSDIPFKFKTSFKITAQRLAGAPNTDISCDGMISKI